MIKLRNGAEVRASVLAACLGFILVIMLVAGLNPRGYPSQNKVSRPVDSPGLAFANYGVAYTPPFVSNSDVAAIAQQGMTVEIVLGLVESTDQTGTIATVHNGDDGSQWYLWQWHQYIILMNGDDYSFEQRLPRISADSSKFAVDRSLLTITSNQAGSIIYLNGEVLRRKPDFVQALPLGGRLVLGNTADGRRPWKGTISGLVFYKVAMGPESVRDRYAQWSQSGEFLPSDVEEPWLLYPLDEREGSQALDHSGHGIHLAVPEETTILKRVFLSRNLDLPLVKQLSTWDAGLNLFGFLPFGLVLASLLAARGTRRSALLLLAVTTAGFALSISIELIQVWMPARSSTALDLALNTIGALVGALFYCMVLAGRDFPDADKRTKSDPN